MIEGSASAAQATARPVRAAVPFPQPSAAPPETLALNDRHDIAVLGPVPHDHITTWQGEVIEKFGGALYTVASLSSLVGEGSRIVPVSHVRRDDGELVRDLLSELPHVDTRHVRSHADRGDVVTLFYTHHNRRVERQTGFMNPITPDDLTGLMDVDAFVCVPITDFEVPLVTLQHIRANSDALIVFDAHGPTTTCTREGERTAKLWVDRDLWLPCIDILKMNRDEASCCWFADEHDPGSPARAGPLPMAELPKLAAHCLARGVRALCVTFDEHGCVMYFNDADGRLREHVIRHVPVEHVIDTTGCGDSFAGGLAYGYLRTGDYVAACHYGNAMGAQRCTSTDLRIHPEREATDRQIAETYRSLAPFGPGR